MKTFHAIIPIMALALLAGGCGKKPLPTPAPSNGAATAEREAAERARLEAEAAARREAEERARREAEDRARREREMASMRATLEEMVFFDFDDARIRSGDQARLDAKVAILRQNPSIRIQIEGHCDERGSNEYNQALGNRRANSVMAYLLGAGIGADQFHLVSWGEERPRSPGHDETSWAQNRRAEFRILAGLSDRSPS